MQGGNIIMKKVRNANGKLVCQVDEEKKKVEIVHKGCKTVVSITTDGQVEIENTKPIT